MKKYINWYMLWLKLYSKRASTWVQLLGMLFLLLILSAVRLPDKENLKVGISGAQGEYGRRILEGLLTDESLFDFYQYGDEEALKRDILSGKLECGFLFHQDFEEKVEKGEYRRTITYMANPLSVKGKVVKETVYAQFFAVYSEEILKQKEGDIFSKEDEERTRKLIRLKQEYADSGAVFQLEILQEKIQEKMEKESLSPKVYPLRGITGLLIFLLMLLSQGRKFIPRQYRVDKALNPTERFFFGGLQKLAAGTLPALAGWVMLLFLGESRGILREGGMLLLLLVSGSIWIMVMEKGWKKETSFVAATLVITLACLLICPIWIDVAEMIPSMNYLRLLFPVGIYLLG